MNVSTDTSLAQPLPSGAAPGPVEADPVGRREKFDALLRGDPEHRQVGVRAGRGLRSLRRHRHRHPSGRRWVTLFSLVMWWLVLVCWPHSWLGVSHGAEWVTVGIAVLTAAGVYVAPPRADVSS